MRRVVRALVLLATIGMGMVVCAQNSAGKVAEVHHAEGTFDVKMKPEPLSETAAKTQIARMSLDKVYHGQLEATGVGEFLAVGSASGSGSYVAIERVTGTLDGKHGSFVLVHQGTMTKGSPELSVTVAPDSGTGELAGIKGTLKIVIAGDKHNYEFVYSF